MFSEANTIVGWPLLWHWRQHCVIEIGWCPSYTWISIAVLYVCTCVLSRVWFFATPWTVACQALLVHGIFPVRILEYISISCSKGSQRIFLTQGLNLPLLHWQADSSPPEPPWKTNIVFTYCNKMLYRE